MLVSHSRKYKNYNGKKFNRLTIIEEVGRSKYSHILVTCICDCGKIVTIEKSGVTGGKVKSCGCLKSEIVSKMRKSIPKKGKEVTYKYYYQKYKDAAIDRNLDFNLTLEEFKSIISENCYWDGTVPDNIISSYLRKDGKVKNKDLKDPDIKYYNSITIIVNGIDRKDNSRGYSIENCVACCKQCNMMKMDYTETQFLNKIKQIYEHKFKDT
jgi:hypothetical protein